MSKHYKPKEFAELLNVSVITLKRWDKDGKLKAFRTTTNRRYYTYEQYL
ncbi:helix-turn-helix domain-containing protein [Clostridium perfringens]|nr:helix-turn-helix domain-containing protein [Clostridium perfringens]MDH2337890.1 helix-turn-helix domain-containing protein [Clostridium perfringens]MDK0765087.1 helix-turn-helix domain-containing protein [Clostridium perfringens]MDK0907020.1 helix-turn-helix domain-containing protein [Clostridium perfringens]MDN4736676.1 helix-turn-helix domain-containing protein [Clostridium perfringens]MDN4740378.1 helix-turn-helix domain-containing protein [Clostridium perfringens]